MSVCIEISGDTCIRSLYGIKGGGDGVVYGSKGGVMRWCMVLWVMHGSRGDVGVRRGGCWCMCERECMMVLQ